MRRHWPWDDEETSGLVSTTTGWLDSDVAPLLDRRDRDVDARAVARVAALCVAVCVTRVCAVFAVVLDVLAVVVFLVGWAGSGWTAAVVASADPLVVFLGM